MKFIELQFKRKLTAQPQRWTVKRMGKFGSNLYASDAIMSASRIGAIRKVAIDAGRLQCRLFSHLAKAIVAIGELAASRSEKRALD
jgi:hypothetical protein